MSYSRHSHDRGSEESRMNFVARRLQFLGSSDPLPPRKTPIKSPEEVAVESAMRRRYEALKDRLILSIDDGSKLAKQLEKLHERKMVNDQPVTKHFKGPLTFVVGARRFGDPDRQFHFGKVYELIKQGSDAVTIADEHLRVTFAYVKDQPWRLVQVMDFATKGQRTYNHSRTIKGTRLS